MHSSIQFRHKATSTYRVEGWRQSLIVQLWHTACRQRYVLRGFYAWYIFFLWWAESCLSIWDVFTGSWALASFLLSQDCLTVEFCFEWSVFSNLCHKLWVLSARGKQGHRLCLTHAIGIHLIWKWGKDKDIAYDPLYWHSIHFLMYIYSNVQKFGLSKIFIDFLKIN